MYTDDDSASPLRRNAIFNALPPAELADLIPHLRIVSLTRGQVTNTADGRIGNVDFPLGAMISVMATFSSGSSCEVAFVGREGFVEADAALTFGAAARMTVVQIAGTVARLRSDVFTDKLIELPRLDRLVRRSLRSRLYITEQIAACNLRHTVTERLARWLLTTSDGIGSDRVGLTQETFAVMLGVRRAGVSEAAAALARRGAVRLGRAAITVADRDELRAAGCECYDAMRPIVSGELLAEEIAS
jgi:CRP-like cAMP-binding protein